MSQIDYGKADYLVRDDLVAAQNIAWQVLAEPGSWLDGERRVAVAREVRNAWSCDLCAARKAALSPFAVEGAHQTVTNLSEAEIEMIHRLSTDSGRLGESWVREQTAAVGEEAYIEMVSIICVVTVTDMFARAIGQPLFELPEPVAGKPNRYASPAAKEHDAWIRFVEPDEAVAEDGDLYGSGPVSPVIKALSLVPDAKRFYWNFADAHYLPNEEVFNLDTDIRAISRMQMELVASRVSALHQCVY